MDRIAGGGGGPDPVWERRHPTQPESWSFDFATPGGALGGFVGLTIWPAPRRAWYWAALVGRHRPYLLVRDLDVPAPRSPTSREIRTDGLWADVNCETPFDHWSLGLEAFGVALDDPGEALGDERGDRTGLGLDLEWEAVAGITPGPAGAATSYAQPCAVHGEILVGGGREVETLAVDGFGWRRHAWGAAVDWFAPAAWVGGRLDGGEPYAAGGRDAAPAGALVRAPLRLEHGARRATLERTLCRFATPAGGLGLGWSEQVVPLGPSAP